MVFFPYRETSVQKSFNRDLDLENTDRNIIFAEENGLPPVDDERSQRARRGETGRQRAR